MSGAHERSPITTTHAGGSKFVAHVRSHEVPTDQSVRAGGEDAAPSPLEMIPVALGGCVALYVHQFCASRGYPDDGLRVEVSPSFASNPSRIVELAVTIRLPAELPPHAMEMLERVARSCPAHNTLAPAVAIPITVVTAASEPSAMEATSP